MSAPLPPDPYKALGIESSADAGTIKTAYRKLVLKCHPDKFPDPTLKAAKQEEFQRVQQAYEILSDEDKKLTYDLDVKARKLREEFRNGGTPSKSRYTNVNIRTAEPPPQPPTAPKANTSFFYSGAAHFSKSWGDNIPSRPKPHEEEKIHTARRAASYEKPRREDDYKEERRREAERERERQYQKEKESEREAKEARRKARELREEREREKEKRHREERVRLREQREREQMEAREAKERRQKERELDRERERRKVEEEKARAKSKPYVEQYPNEDEEELRRSRAKKASPGKKHPDSPPRDKSSRQRDRSSNREGNPMAFNLAVAADYIDATRKKGSKHSATPRYPESYSEAYPDPGKWHPPQKSARRGSGDGKYMSEEPEIIDAEPEIVDAPSTRSARGPPPLHKSYTTNILPQTPTPPPVRVPLTRSQTMQPEYTRSSHATPEKSKHSHKPSRRRNSFDDEELYDDPWRDTEQYRPSQRVYRVDHRDAHPRVVEARYAKPPYDYVPPGSGSGFKVKMGRTFTAEDVHYSDLPHESYQQSYTQAY